MINLITQDNPFGTVTAPDSIAKYGGVEQGGIGNFLNVILKALIVGAGIFALINLIMAGYGMMSAGDDPKKMAAAWQKITMTIIGLAIAAGSFVLAAIFGQLIFGDAMFILNPTIPTP